MKDALWWYANPQNWSAPRSSPGPYSGQSIAAAPADKGRQAREELNTEKTLGGLVRILVFMSGRTALSVATDAGIHPGRFEDIYSDKAHTTPQERLGIARALGVDLSEVDSYVRERIS